MANISQYFGAATVTSGGEAVYSWVGTETLYDAIALVSNSSLATYDTTSANFDANFADTLYFIHD